MLSVAAALLLAPPPGIPVQGQLQNGVGGVAPDGDYGLTFRVYAAAGDTQPLAVDVQAAVTVSEGVFSTVLGATIPLDPEVFRSGEGAWLGVQVGSEPELPRQPLRTVPYAQRAEVSADLRCIGCVTPEETSFMGCADGSILVREAGAWSCAARPTAKDFALSNQTCPAGQVIRGLKADGTLLCTPDNDTTYSGANFALSSAGCPTGQVMTGVGADGLPTCAPDKDTTYSGANFALSSQSCGANQVMKGVDATGKPVCVASMPPGLIGFFLGGCPSGWTEVSELRGRTVLGTPAGGVDGLTVGSPLGNGGLRQITDVPAHSHSADPTSFNSAAAGGHTHDLDPAAVTSSVAGDHSHTVDPPITNSSTNGAHTHTAYAPVHDTNSSSSQGYPANNVHNAFRSSDRARDYGLNAAALSTEGSHLHSVDIGAFTSASAGGHSHAVDLPNMTTTSSGSHQHSVDVPAFTTGTTGSPSVDVTMPYLQLTACRFAP